MGQISGKVVAVYEYRPSKHHWITWRGRGWKIIRSRMKQLNSRQQVFKDFEKIGAL